eukprot:gene48203-59038_t
MALSFAALGVSGAEAGQIVNTAFLSDFTATVTPSGNSDTLFNLNFVGVFLVPAVPSGLTIRDGSLKMEYDFGITSWSQNIPGNVYGGSLSGGMGWGPEPGVGWIEKYNTFNPSDGPIWQVAVSHKQWGDGGVGPEIFSADGSYAQGGYVPYYLRIDMSIGVPTSAPVPVDASYLIHIGGLRLVSSIDVAQAVPAGSSGTGDVPVGSSSGLVWYRAAIGSGGDEIPAALRSNLPAYIP